MSPVANAAVALRRLDEFVRAGDWVAAGNAHAVFVEALLDLVRELGDGAAASPVIARIRERYQELDVIVRAEHALTNTRLDALAEVREAWLAYEQAGEFR